ncbi:BolA/IbaG family iron-sulfur metabolism protein [Wolbachia endosymbiont of Cruorifilaria tuberocauda]|nr:BolA/IbaG family iron-sulfur metabolism protein [Wolbachia endosymbiont of Cruorifilaria tuberocauda]
MSIINLMEKKVRNAIDIVSINIIDESMKHVGHYFHSSLTFPSHIKLILVSNSFVGMNTMKRHKLICKLLKDEIKLIHAISFHFYTQSEYNLKNR